MESAGSFSQNPLRYQWAPEHRYPAQLDDCKTSTCHFHWLRQSSVRILIGDGRQDNLAAWLCQRLIRQVQRHLLSPCSWVLMDPAQQMADFNLSPCQQSHAMSLLFCCFDGILLPTVGEDVSVCQCAERRSHSHLRPCSGSPLLTCLLWPSARMQYNGEKGFNLYTIINLSGSSYSNQVTFT